MNERHRQQQFVSPFDPHELELDPEKKLWVPGRKKIFIPSSVPSPVRFSYDLETIFQPSLLREFFFRNVCICIPERSRYIAPASFRVPLSYRRSFYTIGD